jgi:hypothetical protein
MVKRRYSVFASLEILVPVSRIPLLPQVIPVRFASFISTLRRPTGLALFKTDRYISSRLFICPTATNDPQAGSLHTHFNLWPSATLLSRPQIRSASAGVTSSHRCRNGRYPLKYAISVKSAISEPKPIGNAPSVSHVRASDISAVPRYPSAWATSKSANAGISTKATLRPHKTLYGMLTRNRSTCGWPNSLADHCIIRRHIREISQSIIMSSILPPPQMPRAGPARQPFRCTHRLERNQVLFVSLQF